MNTNSYIGIAFGTTNTSVVQITTDEHGQRTRILGENGEFPFPSLLAIDNTFAIKFGNEVKANRDFLSANCKVISSFKSILGTDKIIEVYGKRFKPVVLLTEYLKCLKSYIQKRHNVTITKAAFSFPVNFTREARTDLIRAAREAGIEVSSLISESTAAYLATQNETNGLQRVMVVDWGGGTLDVSLLEVTAGKVREIAVDGQKIGGDDIDRELAHRIHAMLRNKLEDKSRAVLFDEMAPEYRDKLVNYCENAKIQMSEDGRDYLLTIRDYGIYGTKTVKISTELFEDILKPIIEKHVILTIQRVLNRAELTAGSIDGVVIAGGSSSLRLFDLVLENIFGEEKLIRPRNFQFVSAEGAAITNLIGGSLKLNDDVGILMSDDTVLPILEKGKDGVSTESKQYIFSLVEDSPNAHFIFTNGDGRNVYHKINVPTKGFLKEHLQVKAQIGFDQIARIQIQSDAAPDKEKRTVEIGGLTYYYDLTNQ